jgi:hypothetical protein
MRARLVRSKIVSSHPLKSTSVVQIEHEVVRKGSRKKYFVLKRTREPECHIANWVKVHSRLRELKIPTSKSFAVEPPAATNDVKQTDFSRARKIHVIDAWRVNSLRSIYKRPFVGVARDLGLMHANGVTLNPDQFLFSPWAFYKKPNGKIDRTIIDYGSIRLSTQEVAVSSNFRTFINFLKRTNSPRFMQSMLDMYFSMNSDSALRKIAREEIGYA